MKNKFLLKLSISILLASFLFVACEDRSDLTAPSNDVNTGSVSFARTVFVGNSLTAGYQSGSLFESAQANSFGALIARQVNTTFEQPIVSDPGTAGRMEVAGFTAAGLPEIVYNKSQGDFTNLTYAKPYNNLGVPGAWLADALFATDAATSVGKVPLFDAILRGIGTQIHQMKLQQPTFVSFWLGNNDILGYASMGGTVPHNDPTIFGGLYSMIMDSLAETGAKVIVANIPSVLGAPYFTVVGPSIGLAIKPAVDAGLAFGLFYNKNGETGPASVFATPTQLFAKDVIVTLSASPYSAYIGKPFDFYTASGLPVPAGIDVSQPFGLHPQNPMPDVFILDADEITETNNVVNAFNSAIATLAGAKGFPIVDIYSFFNEVTAPGGITVNGINFTADYITGNTFSLDGIHPSSQGYAVVANRFISKINASFKASIPLIDVSLIPGSLEFGKKVQMKKGIPQIEPGALDNLLF